MEDDMVMTIVVLGITPLLAGNDPMLARLETAPPPKRVRPKPPPPPPATSDPAQAANDPDFLIQGEYTAIRMTASGPIRIGIQIVAQGAGKFASREYRGGLPGDGWDGKPTRLIPLTGTPTNDGKVLLESQPGEPYFEIQGSQLLSADPNVNSLTRILRQSPTLNAKPPAGAVVLFAKPGDELAHWTNGRLVELSDGQFLAAGAMSKQLFRGFHAHVEFRTPWMPTARNQQRGNSGVYLQHRYEIQVLDSFGLDGKNNECGALYTQTPPRMNMCFPPLTWQTYDIDFTPAVFDGDGKKIAPARITLVHNGVLVHDNVELPNQTGHGKKEDTTPGPIWLQDHRTPVVYRNIWLVEKQ
jgi:hypothetical protein